MGQSYKLHVMPCLAVLTRDLCLLCRPAWRYITSDPIFSTPVVDSLTHTLFLAAVTGTVTALSFAGQPLWQINLGSKVFAPLCLLPVPHTVAASIDTEAAAEATAGAAAASASAAEPCAYNYRREDDHTGHVSQSVADHFAKTSEELYSSSSSRSNCSSDGSMIVVGTVRGRLHCLSCSSGQHIWHIDTGQSISTAAALCPVRSPSECAIALQAAALPMQQPSSTAMELQPCFRNTVISCTNQGNVRVLNLPAVASHEAWSQLGEEEGQHMKHFAVQDIDTGCMPSLAAAAQMPGMPLIPVAAGSCPGVASVIHWQNHKLGRHTVLVSRSGCV